MEKNDPILESNKENDNQILVQDLLIEDLLEEDNPQNEFVEAMEHFTKNGVPLTNDQSRAIFILHEYGLSDISNYILNVRKHMTPVARIYKFIDSLTMANRIKGNAKLSKVLQQQMQAPQDPSAPISRKEMR